MRFSVKNKSFKKLKYLFFFIIIILVFIMILLRFEPLFWSRVESYAVFYAENAVNDAVTEVLTKNSIKYNDLINLKENSDGKISVLLVDNIKVNSLKSEISREISKSIKEAENGYIYLNAGTISGSPLFSGLGPKIKIKISPSNKTLINFKDELEESGINQVRHTLYLDLTVHINITSAISQKTSEFKTVIPVADTIIVGTVPQYLGTSGMNIIGE